MAYADNYMRYDDQAHRYVLTPSYVAERLNIDLSRRLNSAGSIDRANAPALLLERVSQEVYSYIYEHGAENDLQEYILGTDEQARQMIMHAMGEQVLYIITNGDLGLASGVDGSTMTGAGQSVFAEARVAPNVKALLARSLSAYKCPIVYLGRFPHCDEIRVKLPAYEESGY